MILAIKKLSGESPNLPSFQIQSSTRDKYVRNQHPAGVSENYDTPAIVLDYRALPTRQNGKPFWAEPEAALIVSLNFWIR